MEIILILVSLLSALVLAKIFGEIAERFNQPSLIGELVAGILIGPIFLLMAGGLHIPVMAEIPHILRESEVFKILSDMGIFFLMVIAGMEIGLDDMFKNWKPSLLTAIGGVMLPLTIGYFIGSIFGYPILTCLFLGLAMATTAIAVSVRTLLGMRKLKTKAGATILGAAVIDDIIGLILLTLLLGMAETRSLQFSSIPILALKLLAFFVFIFLSHKVIIPIIMKIARYMKTSEARFSLAIIVALAMGALSEVFGLHFIIGAFFAGVAIKKAVISHEVAADVNNKLSGLALGFLTPIFFLSLGMAMDFLTIKASYIPIIIIIILCCVIGKISGAFVGAFSSGLSIKNSVRVAFGMNGKGAVDLIVAELGRRMGAFSPELFTAIILLAFISTVITPTLLKISFKGADKLKTISEHPSGNKFG